MTGSLNIHGKIIYNTALKQFIAIDAFGRHRGMGSLGEMNIIKNSDGKIFSKSKQYAK